MLPQNTQEKVMSKKYFNVGQILKSKQGKLYIKVKEDISLKAEEAIFIDDATLKFERMLERDKISEEDFNREMEAHAEGGKKEFIKYDLTFIRE